MSKPPSVVEGTRLVGLDVARALALLGMVATHVVAERGGSGELSVAHALAGGRASALFAVLAGVSLALVTGRRTPLQGRDRVRAAVAIAVRAVLVATVGLLLGGLESGVAVILAYYGVLFLLGLPFLGLRAPALFTLAALWTVLGPIASREIRGYLPTRGVESPQLAQLSEPGHLLSELLLTGYYPALLWLAYLLVGLGVGRLDLHARRVQVRLLGAGAVLAVTASVVSWVATRAAGFSELELDRVASGMFGQTPTGDWRWLLVVAPHSSTPFDLAQTIGSALAVVGLCLLALDLLVRPLGARAERAVAVLFGAGAVTLTLYTLHVLMLALDLPPRGRASTFALHVVVLVAIGAAFGARRLRGPLELLVGLLPRRIAGR